MLSTKTIIYIFKSTLIGSFIMFFAGCIGSHMTTGNIALHIKSTKKTIQLYDTIAITVRHKKNHSIDSVAIKIGDRQIMPINDSVILTGIRPGKHDINATVFYDGKSQSLKKKITILANTAPKIYTYTIVNTYPHDREAYTQGLEFYNDTLYESTGKTGKSTLRKVDYKTGKTIMSTSPGMSYFGEGITILNHKIYMLTWQSNKGFIYDAKTLAPLASFAYNKSKEGWGLCNDGKKLYKSDGTEKIWILDPETLLEEDYIQMASNTSIFSKANELEFIQGKIYANTYQKDGVMIINPDNGIIEGVIDFRGLKEKVTPHPELDVLNGIAYNPGTATLFVTGKNWDILFEVILSEKTK